MFELVFFSLLNGLVYGMLLFMLASGLTLIFGMMGVLNFAHAAFYMLGAYFAYTIVAVHWASGPALVVAPLAGGRCWGCSIERYGLRRVHRLRARGRADLHLRRGHRHRARSCSSSGGGPAKSYEVPAALDFALFHLFHGSFPAYKAFMLAVSVAIFLFLSAAFMRTRAGLIIQASLTHPGMVAMLGHNVPRVFMVVFGIGSALAGLAGVIAGPVLGTFPGMAQVLGSIVFVVVVIGGLGSLTGALRRLAAHRYSSDLRGGPQRLGGQRADRAGRADRRGLRALHDLWRITVAQVAPIMPYLLLVLSPHRAAHRALRDARDVSMPAPTAARSSSTARGPAEPAAPYGLGWPRPSLLAALPHVVRTAAAVPVMNQMGIAVVFALSYNMLLGQGGMLSFGHAVYFGARGLHRRARPQPGRPGRLYLPVPLLPLVGGLGGLLLRARSAAASRPSGPAPSSR